MNNIIINYCHKGELNSISFAHMITLKSRIDRMCCYSIVWRGC